MRVGDRMTPDPFTLSPKASMRDAVVLQRRHQFRHIPVVEGTTLVGIVTDRDLRRASPSILAGVNESDFDAVLDSTPVARLMTREPITVSPETDVVDAVRILVTRKIGGLPVVKDGRLVGIFTESDAMKVLLEVLEAVPR